MDPKDRRKFENILREPLTRHRLFLNAKLRAAQDPENPQPFTLDNLRDFMANIPSTGPMASAAPTQASSTRRTWRSADWTTNADTIIHEAAHQTAFNTGVHTRCGDSPRWLVEGLGTMFEARKVRAQRRHDIGQPIAEVLVGLAGQQASATVVASKIWRYGKHPLLCAQLRKTIVQSRAHLVRT